MDPTPLQILSSPLTALIALLAAAGGGLFGALVGLGQLRHLAEAVRAQTRATELARFTHFNMKFLDIAERFEEHINEPDIKLDKLSPLEKRAIDRYFYLASMEFILQKEKLISKNLAELWLKGIRSAARRPAFAERWERTASKFTVDEDFRVFFDSSLAAAKEERERRAAQP